MLGLATGWLLGAAACSSKDETPGLAGTGGSASGSAGSSGVGGDATAGSATAGSSSGGTAGSASGGASGAGTGGGGTAGAAMGGSSSSGASGTGTGGSAAGQAGSAGTGSGGRTPGCGQTGAATGVMNDRTIMVAGQARNYVLSVPAAYDADTAYPLVFAWHGLGGDGALARQYFRIEQQAGSAAVLVYPDGLPIANQGNEPGWDLGAEGIDVQLFDALLSALSDAYCIDRSRVFSTGHSFGGFFTNRLACSRGDVLRAIAPVAGAPPFGMATCTTGVAAWIAHGMNDPTVDFSSGEDTRDFWTSLNECGATSAPVEPSPCIAFDGCAAGRPVHFCAHPGEHEWPMFAAGGIWSFFSSFD